MRPETEKTRSITEKELRAIKGVTDAALDLAGGPTVTAMRCRPTGSQLSKYANFCHPMPDGRSDQREVYVPLDVAIEIDRAAGSPAILSIYAELLGFELVPLVAIEDAGAIDEQDAHQLTRKSMALAEEIFAAREDGVINSRERKAIVGKCHQLKRYLNCVLRRIGGDA